MNKEISTKPFSERINYVIEDGQYCGHTVNMPIVLQCRSLDELKAKTVLMVKIYIRDLQRMVDNNLFEYVDQTDTQNKVTI